jgi:UDP-N-acetylmuramoyl-L-alanyl-D-glutamate--2,6-diaminopimelate ligase
MRPSLRHWLEREKPVAQTEGVGVWLDEPLPPITHRLDHWSNDQAFIKFKADSPCPDGVKDVLLVSSELQSDYEAQLVFEDLPRVSREWSLSYHKESIDAIKLCGVTGTNGKSSVAHFLAHLLKSNTRLPSVAKLGTLGLETSRLFLESPNTTPFPLDLHPMLERIYLDGDRYLVMEASSHALDQKRLEGLSFEVVGMTNLTQDHLDYHKTMENLFASKSKLLDLCTGKVLINLDCEWVSKHRHHERAMTFSCHNPDADVYAELLGRYDHGFVLQVYYAEAMQEVHLPLLGDFNISNCLCALGMALAIDDSAFEVYCHALSQLSAPKGRLQIVDCPAKGKVIIDYAHTPDALDSILKTMRRDVPQGKLKLLFGCGGNRDKKKRAIMGEIAARHADYVYLTSDNPRYEDPEKIIQDIEKGLKEFDLYEVVPSREEAIVKSLRELKQDEVILLCGKGHETTQEVQGEKIRMCEEEICQTI